MPSLMELKIDPDRLLDEAELCQLIGKSRGWAQRHRWAGTGIPFHKLGRSVRYRAGDVLAWIETGRRDTADGQKELS